MNVEQIINELTGYAAHLPVVTSGYERGYCWLNEHGVIRLKLNANSKEFYGPHNLAGEGDCTAVFLGAAHNTQRYPFSETTRCGFIPQSGSEAITVGQLIAHLQTCDPEMMVVVCGYEAGYSEVNLIRDTSLRLNVNKESYYGPHEKAEGGECFAVFLGSTQADQDKTWNMGALDLLFLKFLNSRNAEGSSATAQAT
ncbi:MAG: hypothetical protein NTY98_05270 [Verrucomicrobia bacterium]|nr:hypothetical protein [Verrucomicrobiota bacterium]